MAGGLHVFDMIKRLRENDNLRKKDYFKSQRGKVTGENQLEDRTEISEEERLKLRDEIIASNNREKKRMIRVLIVASLLTAILVVFAMFMFSIFFS